MEVLNECDGCLAFFGHVQVCFVGVLRRWRKMIKDRRRIAGLKCPRDIEEVDTVEQLANAVAPHDKTRNTEGPIGLFGHSRRETRAAGLVDEGFRPRARGLASARGFNCQDERRTVYAG